MGSDLVEEFHVLKEDYWSKARDWCCRAHGSGDFAIISLKIFKLKIIIVFKVVEFNWVTVFIDNHFA